MTPQQQETLNQMMMDAVQAKDLTQLKLCVGKGADIGKPVRVEQEYCDAFNNWASETPPSHLFHEVCRSSFDAAILDYLIGQGVNVDVPDDKGNTALLWAVRWGEITQISYLLKNNADPLAANKLGKSPFDEAARLPEQSIRQKRDIRQMLLNALPDVKKDFNSASGKGADEVNDAALTRDIPAPEPYLKKPAKKSGGEMEL